MDLITDEIIEAAAQALWEADSPAPDLGWPHWDVAKERAANGLWDLPKMVADTYTMARAAVTAFAPLIAGRALRQAAKGVSRLKPETGLHINESEYRRGKADGVILSAALVEARAESIEARS